MAHIVLIGYTPTFGGIEKNEVNLAHYFQAQGHRVTIIACQNADALKPYTQPGINIQCLNIRFPLLAPFYLMQAICLIRKLKPDLIIASGQGTNIFSIVVKHLSFVRTKLMISVHNIDTLRAKILPHKETQELRIALYLSKFLYRLADDIVAVSENVATDTCKSSHIARSRVAVIYNPIITQEDLTQSYDKPNHSWFEEQTPIVLGCGRLVTAKNFTSLIQAMQHVRKTMNARLMLLGDGPLRAELTTLANSLGLEDHVHFAGFVTNPKPYMYHANVFVLSSIVEGFGNVLAEALSTGTPIISTDGAGPAAEVLDNGRYGMIVEHNHPEMMAEAIVKVLNKPRPDRSIGRKRAAEFSIEKSGRTYLETAGF